MKMKYKVGTKSFIPKTNDNTNHYYWNIICDIIAQQFVEQRGLKSHNFYRTLRLGGFGLCIASCRALLEGQEKFQILEKLGDLLIVLHLAGILIYLRKFRQNIFPEKYNCESV
ncbi:hypothetical protein RhiirC2_864028 [Rhizophagus irregularis]|uniref:Uncharacterized protein n=1 Tax=Rhizophagus irregularis TaxID=588596 RepID=A0A2N1NJL9_9GLOM|nr:hypothetical protein RhiirC2_864028 [Rhizophagus irregularis]